LRQFINVISCRTLSTRMLWVNYLRKIKFFNDQWLLFLTGAYVLHSLSNFYNTFVISQMVVLIWCSPACHALSNGLTLIYWGGDTWDLLLSRWLLSRFITHIEFFIAHIIWVRWSRYYFRLTGWDVFNYSKFIVTRTLITCTILRWFLS